MCYIYRGDNFLQILCFVVFPGPGLEKEHGGLMKRKNIRPIASVSFFCSFVTLMVYLPALQNGFVNFDDNVYVYENTLIRTLDWEFIRDSFFGFYYLNWHPL